MVIVMTPNATQTQIEKVNKILAEYGFAGHMITGVNRIVIGAVGDRQAIASLGLETLAGVEKVVPIRRPYKLVSREAKEENTIVHVKDVAIGGDAVTVIGGPCAIESVEQVMRAAEEVRRCGGKILRGGAFKPRTSPYAFQGLEEEGLKIMRIAGRFAGLPTVSEVIDEASLELASQYLDMVQIGARNMQNFRLLQAVGRARIPVILKRGLSATIEEWLMAAEYILSEGNSQVILCERGIRTYETATRNTLDLSAIPLVKELSHLPILVDPSHATGASRLVKSMSKAAVAAGADGLLVEVHPEPCRALCDGPQSLDPEGFEVLMKELAPVARAVNRLM
ncbi:3-deoxy-7-phosphoheptulonate synthase [Heliobacterium undosum]|uniref:3-deoxy-7-phosphoheptulonate synthase n=1 Tax=Heliomicrobium undosum TaxID=121734 RepID=A0A845KYE0_9FIRM|nr:3-deoxy-7-phosphoheptulonate synthase [Heliomicrobium undosum]MZP28867.1 3-deoxy-7-phosphoheptulonate synthase [Heliomicrobium undosum]